MNMKFLALTVAVTIAAHAFAQDASTTDSNANKDDFSKSTIWSSWKTDSSVGEFLWNKDEGHNGKGAMEIAIGKDCPGDASFCFLKHFSAIPGKTYNAVVWVKAENITASGEVTLTFQGQDAEKKFLGAPVIASTILGAKIGEGWQQRILTFTIPAEGAWSKTRFMLCTFGVRKAFQGKVFFDDFDFWEIEPKNITGDNIYEDDFTTPIIWTDWKSDLAVGKFLWNKDEGHNGKGAMEIAIGKDCPSDVSFCFLKHLPAVSGKTYNAVVWVKAEGVTPSGEISLAFQGQDAEKKFLGTPVISSMILGSDIGEGWQRRILTFTIPGDGAWSKTGFLLCTLGIGKASQGKVVFDDFSFFENK